MIINSVSQNIMLWHSIIINNNKIHLFGKIIQFNSHSADLRSQGYLSKTVNLSLFTVVLVNKGAFTQDFY